MYVVRSADGLPSDPAVVVVNPDDEVTAETFAAWLDRRQAGNPVDPGVTAVAELMPGRCGFVQVRGLFADAWSRGSGPSRRPSGWTPFRSTKPLQQSGHGCECCYGTLGQRMPINDTWIAATAMSLEVPVVTQDDGFPDVEGLSVTRV